MHHIFPEQRKTHVENLYQKLNQGGCYLSLCFSEADPQFGGTGKHRRNRLGTVLYFSSEEAMHELLVPFFRIDELRTV